MAGFREVLIAALAAGAIPVSVHASLADLPPGRFPLRAYTLQDGLLSDRINDLHQDSRGYLWIATDNGLARFDGRLFTGYRAGLTHVHEVVEDGRGRIWFAASDGLHRIEPSRGPSERPVTVRLLDRRVESLLPEGASALWAAGGDRLYRIEFGPEGEVSGVAEEILDAPYAGWDAREASAIAADDDGCLWIATAWGAIRRLPNGGQVYYRAVPTGQTERIHAIMIDRDGLVWLAHGTALVVLRPRALGKEQSGDVLDLRAGVDASLLRAAPGGDGRWLPSAPGSAFGYRSVQGVEGVPLFGALLQRRNGEIWIGTTSGVSVFDGRDFVSHSDSALGFTTLVRSLAEDSAGNLWIGTEVSGLHRLSALSLRSWDAGSGFQARGVAAITEKPEGGVVAVTRSPYGAALLKPQGIETVRFRLPTPPEEPGPRAATPIARDGWGWGQLVSIDSRGDWWVPSDVGLLRFPGGSLDEEPREVFDSGNGIGGAAVFRTWLDSRDDLWIGTFCDPACLARREAATGAFRLFTGADGFPTNNTPTSFCEEPRGAVWMGLYGGGLVRFDGDRFESYTAGEGIPPGLVSGLACVGDGVLWVGFEGSGLARLARGVEGGIEVVRRWTVADGLSSDIVTAIGMDVQARVYVGSSRGLDRLDPVSGHIETFTRADGLASNHLRAIYRDRRDRMWLVSGTGVAVLDPAPRHDTPPPMTVVTDFRADGQRAAMPEFGTGHLAGLESRAGAARIEIAWSAIDFEPGRRLGFQHRLAGLETEWSPPDDGTSIQFGRLGPGSYRFEVRAVEGGVQPVGEIAAVEFLVPAPFWQRAWFLGLVGLGVLLAGYGVHRVRVGRLLALERQRTRIAMDLHDEVGSGLGSIGLLADMVADDATAPDRRRTLATDIGDAAGELGVSLADIVGALRPEGATIQALGRHLAERGRRLFPAESGCVFTAVVPDGAGGTVPTALPVRRNVFRIGLEALHNTARHAGASRVVLRLEREGRGWRLVVTDDGCGHDGAPGVATGPTSGLGLEAMRRRAAEIGARLDWTSARGEGTTVEVTFDPGVRRRII